MDYQKTGLEVFEAVGGNDNVISVTHCATRLRFRLKNEKTVDKNNVEKISGVLKCLTANGEIQVVIGPNVTVAYQAIDKVYSGNNGTETAKEKKSLGSRFLGMISGIFAPIIPAITAAGMVKAVMAILKVLSIVDVDSQLYQILNFASDAAFYFMPIMLANSAAKIFNMSSGLAMMLAGMMLHPNFVAMVNGGEPINLLGIPVRAATYSATVIPVILIVFVASYVERFANKILPDVIKYIARPLIVMIVMIPLSLCILGPIGYIAGDGLAAFLSFVNGLTPWLLPTIMGTFTPILVLFGLHNGLIPLASSQLSTLGHENIMGPGMLPSNIAQGAASIAIALRSKNKQTKQEALSAGFTALMGITEPAMYGVTLKYKMLLPVVMLGGFAGGLFGGITGLVRYSFGSPGLATLPVFIGESPTNILKALGAAAIGFAVTFVGTMFIKLDDSGAEKKNELEKSELEKKEPALTSTVKHEMTVESPLQGYTVMLDKLEDETFSQKILGDGIAVIPDEGKITAPFDGKVMIYDTKHAIGLTGTNGEEILIHVGMNTVELGGKYFQATVKSGALVKKGDILLNFEIENIKKAGYDLTTPVLILNQDGTYRIDGQTEKYVKRGEPLFKVKKI